MKNLIVSVLALCAGVLIFSSPAAAGGIPVEDEEPVEEEVLVESDAVSAPALAAEPEKNAFPGQNRRGDAGLTMFTGITITRAGARISGTLTLTPSALTST